jgi:hypothetical protein
MGAKRKIYIGYERSKEVDWEKKNIGGWIISKWILEREGGMVWTGLSWLRIGNSGGLL